MENTLSTLCQTLLNVRFTQANKLALLELWGKEMAHMKNSAEVSSNNEK